MSQDLDEQIRAELERKKGAWGDIATKTGVSHSWLSKFVNRKIPNPGYGTLMALRRHFDACNQPQEAGNAA